MHVRQDNLQQLAARLAEATDWLSAPELAAGLHTTTRTIRNYIAALNDTADGPPLVMSGPRGYRWNAEQGAKRELYQISRKLPETPAERQDYLIRKLLFGTQTRLDVLSQALMVSDRTVQLDLEQLRPQLREYGLRLHQQREVLSISGPEVEKRRLSADCILRTCRTQLLTGKLLRQAFPDFPVTEIEVQLDACLAAYGLRLNAYFRYPLLLHLLVQLSRIQAGFLIHLELPVCVPVQAPDLPCAGLLTARLSEHYALPFPPPETGYTAVLLACLADHDGPVDFLEQTEFSDLAQQTRKAFHVVRRRVGADLPGAEVPTSLVHHVHRMLLRSRMKLSVMNPISDQLRCRNPYFYDCAAWVMTQFIQDYQIQPTEGEIAFLALRLHQLLPHYAEVQQPVSCALICPEFEDTAQRLTEKLRRSFGDRLRPLHVVTATDVEELPDVELCLSVLPAAKQRHTVQITPFWTDQDAEAVRRELDRMEQIRQWEYLRSYLRCYSGPEYFETVEGFASREAAIGAICARLERDRIVGPGFRGTLLQREQAASTAVLGQVALPHACTSEVQKNTICILKSRTPIPWGETEVRMVILMALQRSLLDDFKYIYSLLLRWMNQPKNLAAFLSADSYPALMEEL